MTALHLITPNSPLATDFDSNIPLALAYGAAVLLWMRGRFTDSLAAAGRMALTSYLAKSIVLGVIFYSDGFGLFGRLGPAAAALSFGPFEWLWRSLTYGRRITWVTSRV